MNWQHGICVKRPRPPALPPSRPLCFLPRTVVWEWYHVSGGQGATYVYLLSSLALLRHACTVLFSRLTVDRETEMRPAKCLECAKGGLWSLSVRVRDPCDPCSWLRALVSYFYNTWFACTIDLAPVGDFPMWVDRSERVKRREQYILQAFFLFFFSLLTPFLRFAAFAVWLTAFWRLSLSFSISISCKYFSRVGGGEGSGVYYWIHK